MARMNKFPTVRNIDPALGIYAQQRGDGRRQLFDVEIEGMEHDRMPMISLTAVIRPILAASLE